MSLIPLPWKLAGIAFLLLVVAGAYFGWAYHERELGAAAVIAADAKAVAVQKTKDAALSAEIVANQAVEIAKLQDRAQTVITRIVNAPSTSGCGPVMRDASHGVRDLFDQAGGPPARRQPAAAVPGPGTGR